MPKTELRILASNTTQTRQYTLALFKNPINLDLDVDAIIRDTFPCGAAKCIIHLTRYVTDKRYGTGQRYETVFHAVIPMREK